MILDKTKTHNNNPLKSSYFVFLLLDALPFLRTWSVNKAKEKST